MSFRPIDLDRDAELCVRFRRDAYVCSFGSDELFDEQFEGEAEYLAWLRERQALVPEGIVHAWREQQIIGQIELGPGMLAPVYVSLFYLVPGERGTDAAAALHGHVVDVLRRRGALRADLHVAQRNTRAFRYYQKHGWQDLGPSPSDARVHRMRLELAP